MAGSIKTNSVVLGDSATDTQNFQLRTNVDGTATLARGAAGNLGNVLTVDAAGKASFPQGFGAGNTNQSMVRVNTANGYGSTSTAIRRFTTVVTNQGTDITYADSATLGATFTINASGVYAVSYTENGNSVRTFFGITLNAALLTVAPVSLAVAEQLSCNTTGTTAGDPSSTGWTGYLPAGSVIRAQTDTAAAANNARTYFTITRVA